MERDAVIIAGFGFSKQATPASFQSALLRAGGLEISKIATLEDKARHMALRLFSDVKAIPITPVALADAGTMTCITMSERSLKEYGLGSVAEACALATAGAGAQLIGPRAVSADGYATCALARVTP
ncbi:MAG: cobalamin biosynthesis protein [Pseudomonadota bacterium]